MHIRGKAVIPTNTESKTERSTDSDAPATSVAKNLKGPGTVQVITFVILVAVRKKKCYENVYHEEG